MMIFVIFSFCGEVFTLNTRYRNHIDREGVADFQAWRFIHIAAHWLLGKSAARRIRFSLIAIYQAARGYAYARVASASFMSKRLLAMPDAAPRNSESAGAAEADVYRSRRLLFDSGRNFTRATASSSHARASKISTFSLHLVGKVIYIFSSYLMGSIDNVEALICFASIISFLWRKTQMILRIFTVEADESRLIWRELYRLDIVGMPALFSTVFSASIGKISLWIFRRLKCTRRVTKIAGADE